MAAPSRERLERLLDEERRLFSSHHPISGRLFERAKGSLLGGVPMPWMTEWAGAYPVFVASAQGSRFTDVDGHRYVDFCLGDTGAMTGHAPPPAVHAIAAQASRGITLMLPTEDAAWVGAELARRFRLPYWQFCLTATDANRFSIRMARQLTGRPKVLVFNYCYHGSVDEALVTLENGRVVPRRGAIGPPVDPSLTTRVIEWNDPPALEVALTEGDVACVLAEPAMTNIGIILPDDGFHASLRELTRRAGTLLVIDETHTLCTGPGGYTAAFDLEPDLLTVGKPLASGVPAAAYGIREAAAVVDSTLDRFLHLYALNRGVLMTPFHNMALMSPETTSEDVDTHTRVFAAAVDELLVKDV